MSSSSSPFTQADPPRRLGAGRPSPLAGAFELSPSSARSRNGASGVLPSSSRSSGVRSQTPDSQLSQHALKERQQQRDASPRGSGQEGSTAGTSSRTDSGVAGKDKDKGDRTLWTNDEMNRYLIALRANEKAQHALLPGHRQADEVNHSHKTSNNHYFRELIDAAGLDRKVPQMRTKLTYFVSKYRQEMQLMSQTGKGLLLSEMREKTSVRNLREALLNRHPWFDLMHEMMRNRVSSDPDLLVTSSGEIRLQGSSGNSDDSDDEEEDEDSARASDGGHSYRDNWERRSSFELHGDHGLDGLPYLQQESLRAELDRYRQSPFDDQDFDDADEDSQMREATPKSRPGGASARRAYVEDDDEADSQAYPSAGPGLSWLADQARRDPMSAGTSRGTSRRNSIPPSLIASPAKPGGKTVNRTTSPPKATTKRTQASTADALAEKLSREFHEERRVRTELAMEATMQKEQTRQMRIEMKHKEKERRGEDIEVRLATICGKLESIQVSLNQQANQQVFMMQQCQQMMTMMMNRQTTSGPTQPMQAPPFSPLDFAGAGQSGSGAGTSGSYA